MRNLVEIGLLDFTGVRVRMDPRVAVGMEFQSPFPQDFCGNSHRLKVIPIHLIWESVDFPMGIPTDSHSHGNPDWISYHPRNCIKNVYYLLSLTRYIFLG